MEISGKFCFVLSMIVGVFCLNLHGTFFNVFPFLCFLVLQVYAYAHPGVGKILKDTFGYLPYHRCDCWFKTALYFT